MTSFGRTTPSEFPNLRTLSLTGSFTGYSVVWTVFTGYSVVLTEHFRVNDALSVVKTLTGTLSWGQRHSVRASRDCGLTRPILRVSARSKRPSDLNVAVHQVKTCEATLCSPDGVAWTLKRVAPAPAQHSVCCCGIRDIRSFLAPLAWYRFRF